MAVARPRREAGRRPNRACAVCVLHHQLAEFNPGARRLARHVTIIGMIGIIMIPVIGPERLRLVCGPCEEMVVTAMEHR